LLELIDSVETDVEFSSDESEDDTHYVVDNIAPECQDHLETIDKYIEQFVNAETMDACTEDFSFSFIGSELEQAEVSPIDDAELSTSIARFKPSKRVRSLLPVAEATGSNSYPAFFGWLYWKRVYLNSSTF